MKIKSPQKTPPKSTGVAQGVSGAHSSGVKKSRILLVDDHPMMREGLTVNINREPDLEVCGAVSSPGEAMSAICALKPDLMVADLSMPGRSGIEFIKDAHAQRASMPILVLSMLDEMLYAERALRAGARGYIMKDAGASKMVEAIRSVLQGQSVVSQKMSAHLLDNLTGYHPRGSKSPIESLSDRQFEIFRLMGEGKSTKEVAAALHLSPKTVDVHRGHIKEKLHITSTTALLHHAVRWVQTHG